MSDPLIALTSFETAAKNTVTPCYYFCGPWYTWFVTWMAVILVVVLAYGVIKHRRPTDG